MSLVVLFIISLIMVIYSQKKSVVFELALYWVPAEDENLLGVRGNKSGAVG